MNTNEIKIIKASKQVSTCLKMGSFFMFVISILAIIGILILNFSGEAIQKSFLNAFNVTANNGAELSIIPQNLFVLFIFMFIYAIFMSIILYTIGVIFKEISVDCTPFKKRHVIRIKNVSFIIIILSIIGSFSNTLFDLFTINKLTWRMDITGIILGVVIYCLALFFDYGCELQQQSDETL